MSAEPADFAAAELLRAIGAAQAPEPRVLEAAREVLWSAIAIEMLGYGTVPRTATGGAAAGGEEDRGTPHRRRAGRSPDEHKRALGGGSPQ